MDETTCDIREVPILELERRQDDVLRQLDEIDVAILTLVDEFNRRLAESADAIMPHEPEDIGAVTQPS